MSLMDLDSLSKPALVAQFILERRGQGACLSYLEYDVINDWLQWAEQDENKLLLVLADLLPTNAPALRPATSRLPLPLRLLDKKVKERLSLTHFPVLAKQS